MPNELTGRELDAAVAMEVMGFADPIEVSRLKGKPPYVTFMRTAPSRLRLSSSEYGQRWTIDGTKIYCGRPFEIYPIAYYSSSDIRAKEVESEIERRGLNNLYAHYLMEQVGVDGHKSGYDESDLWKIRRATPEKICLAALSAVRSQNAKA